jgi:N-acetylneuraminic acid mutarotase
VTNAVWAYNAQTDTWSAMAAMPTARSSTGAAVYNNIVYVIGGTDGFGNRLDNVESYNPATNTWTEEAPLLVGKSEPSVGLVGSTILAADGYTAGGISGDNEGYNVSSNSWTPLASDPHPRNVACVGSLNGLLYVAGGQVNGGTATKLTDSFKISKNKWNNHAHMPQAVADPAPAVYDGSLYCIGGGDHGSEFVGNVFNYVQIYQP